MGRSGYQDDWDGDGRPELYRNAVKRAIEGKRGQVFFKKLAEAMDAMPVKALIAGELVNEKGECCTMGVLCKTRGLDISQIDYEDPDQVGNLLNIAPSLAAEIAYLNDDDFREYKNESPEQRWQRMRKWVSDKLVINSEC